MADKSSDARSGTRAQLILGSASPRRAALLESIGIAFVVRTVDIDESALVERVDADPAVAVERIAMAKFAAFARQPGARPILLTADTLVACDGVILGKPDTPSHVAAMLETMSGRELTIATAVCVGHPGDTPTSEVVATSVILRPIESHEIGDYVAAGAGMDKAGGLALQAEAGSFIERLEGCWANVLGLPLCAARRLLGAELAICSAESCGTHGR